MKQTVLMTSTGLAALLLVCNTPDQEVSGRYHKLGTMERASVETESCLALVNGYFHLYIMSEALVTNRSAWLQCYGNSYKAVLPV